MIHANEENDMTNLQIHLDFSLFTFICFVVIGLNCKATESDLLAHIWFALFFGLILMIRI